MFPASNAVLIGAALIAGAVNSVAGGGTILTFPSLIAAGQLANVANATSTVALWPGLWSSLWGYRREIKDCRNAVLLLGLPSLIGGGLGATLFAHTSVGLFAHLVPFLILSATLLFLAQEPLSKRMRQKAESSLSDISSTPSFSNRWYGIMLFQLFVAIYGGYFGAGIGILMLSALSILGFTDIHKMNGLKNIFGLLINAVAIFIFIISRTLPGQGTGLHHNQLINWPIALMMAVGAIAGGLIGSGVARKVGQRNVRTTIILIGFALTIILLIHPPTPGG